MYRARGASIELQVHGPDVGQVDACERLERDPDLVQHDAARVVSGRHEHGGAVIIDPDFGPPARFIVYNDTHVRRESSRRCSVREIDPKW